MNNSDGILDPETVESTFNQIHYYINMPKHIKGMVSDLKNNLNPTENIPPAHVVDGATTVISGKLNMPVLTHVPQFMVRTYQTVSF